MRNMNILRSGGVALALAGALGACASNPMKVPAGPTAAATSHAKECTRKGAPVMQIEEPAPGDIIIAHTQVGFVLRACKVEPQESLWVFMSSGANDYAYLRDPLAVQVDENSATISLPNVGIEGITIAAVTATPACATKLVDVFNSGATTINALPAGCVQVASVDVFAEPMVP